MSPGLLILTRSLIPMIPLVLLMTGSHPFSGAQRSPTVSRSPRGPTVSEDVNSIRREAVGHIAMSRLQPSIAHTLANHGTGIRTGCWRIVHDRLSN